MLTINDLSIIFEENDHVDFDSKQHLSCNMSSIYTRLIKEAARCEYYSSDLIYDINAINDALENWDGEHVTKIVAFRDMGVDSNTYFASNASRGALHYYRAIYTVEIVPTPEDYYPAVIRFRQYKVPMEG